MSIKPAIDRHTPAGDMPFFNVFPGSHGFDVRSQGVWGRRGFFRDGRRQQGTALAQLSHRAEQVRGRTQCLLLLGKSSLASLLSQANSTWFLLAWQLSWHLRAHCTHHAGRSRAELYIFIVWGVFTL